MKRLCLSLFVAFSLSSVGAVDFPTISEYNLTITLSQDKFTGNLTVTFKSEISSSFFLKTNSTIQVTSCSVVGQETTRTCTPKIQNDGTTKFEIPEKQTPQYNKINITYTGKYDVDGLYTETFNGKDYYFAHFGYGIPEKIMPTSNLDQIKFTFNFRKDNKDFTKIDNKQFSSIQTPTTEILDLRKFAVVAGTFKPITEDTPLSIQGTEQFKIPSSALTFASNILEKIGKELGKETDKGKILQILFPRSPARDIQGSHLTTQSFKNFLLDPKTADFREKSIRTALVQQLSRHWFGGEVFMEDKWLMTGLSTFFSYYFLDKLPTSDMEKKNFNALDQFILDHVQLGAFEADGFPSSLPLGRYNGINTPYDGVLPDPILYSKGASIMSSLNAFCPEGKFMNGLKEVVKKSSMKVDDFAEVFKDCFPSVDEAKKFFNSWHKNSGYPVVHVEKTNGTTGKFKLTQERFTWSDYKSDSSTWNLRIQWIDSKSVKGHIWMDKKTCEAEVKNVADFIIFNHDRQGHFRVNYDMKTWDAIISQLEKNHTQISAVDRAQIIDDVFSFARSVRNFSQPTPDYRMAFKLFNYLKNERSYIPLKAAFNAIEFLDSALAGSPAHSQLMSHVKSVVEVIYDYSVASNETDHLQKLLKREVSAWACRLGIEKCTKSAEAFYNDYLNKYASEKTPEEYYGVEDILLCTVLSKSKDRWYLIFEKAKNEKSEKMLSYIYGLGCTKDEVMLTKLLKETLSGNLKDYEFEVVSSIMNGNSGNNTLVLKHLNTNKNGKGLQFFEKIVQIIKRHLNKASGEKLSQFIKDNLPSDNRIRSEAEEVANTIKTWDEKKGATIVDSLNKTSGESNVKPISLIITLSTVLPIISYLSRY